MIEFKCLKCEHKWKARVERPLSCPNCKSRTWDTEGYTSCEICNRKFLIITNHHKDGDRENNTQSNIIKLCRDCHSIIHRGSNGEKKKSKSSNHLNRIRNYSNKPEIIKRLEELRNIWFINKRNRITKNENTS